MQRQNPNHTSIISVADQKFKTHRRLERESITERDNCSKKRKMYVRVNYMFCLVFLIWNISLYFYFIILNLMENLLKRSFGIINLISCKFSLKFVVKICNIANKFTTVRLLLHLGSKHITVSPISLSSTDKIYQNC
jgi:hypothetical protein